MKIILTSNTSWYLYNFRLNFIKELLQLGYDVHIISPLDKYVEKLLELGVKHYDIKLSRFKKNIFKDLYFIFNLFKLYHKIKPNFIHNFTIKPVIYGSIAAWFFPSIKIINSIPGLGVLFLNKKKISITKIFIKKLYQIAILNRYKTIFQNPDDMHYFINNNIARKKQCFLIKGSGVDLNRFKKIEKKRDNKNIIFGMMSRMLWSKGVKEFIDSSRIVFNKNPNTKFMILGSPDSNSPDSIPIDWLKKINNEKHLIWMPHKDDVFSFLSSECKNSESEKENSDIASDRLKDYILSVLTGPINVDFIKFISQTFSQGFPTSLNNIFRHSDSTPPVCTITSLQ